MPPEIATDKIQQAEASEIYEFLSQYGSVGEIKIELFRREPVKHKGVKTNGLLETYHEPFDADTVKDTHGGGKYQIRVNKKNTKGRWEYAGARTFDIAGPPRIDPLLNAQAEEDDEPQRGGAYDPIAGQALSMATNLVRSSQDETKQLRAELRAGVRGESDPAIGRMIDGLQAQIKGLQDALDRKDERILDLIGKKPDNSGQERLYGILEKSTDDHATRVTEIRVAHDSELRQLRQFHQNELTARESRFEKELDAVRAGHSREVDSLKDAHRTALESQKNAYEMRIDGLKETQKRLERELNEARTEVAALRAKKELTPLDQIQGLVALRNGFEALSPTDQEMPSSTWERVVGAVMDSPLAQGIAARVAGAGGQPPPQDLVAVRRADGTLAYLPAHVVQQMQQQQQAAAAANGEQPQQPQAPQLDPGEVAAAVAFIEQAFRNGHPPETVAASARNLVPKAILDYMRDQGVDSFLNSVAKIDSSSPLATVVGRQYIRKIAKFLLDGTTTLEDEPAAQPPPDLEDDFEGDLDAAADAAVE